MSYLKKGYLNMLLLLAVVVSSAKYVMHFGIAIAVATHDGDFYGNAGDTAITGAFSIIGGVLGQAGAAATVGAAAGPIGGLVGGLLGLG